MAIHKTSVFKSCRGSYFLHPFIDDLPFHNIKVNTMTPLSNIKYITLNV